ncbi:S8 family serine peptidase [Mesobacillus selenatarsenatis]|uniref:S8 family serine peptidase n=1 Tax=Mesobacillus selenatarsenatis TaxID=388741 RepID=A0A846TIQ2_9BACI|nr:S8 family serine peptidase [Mesobacillus selenatarsenatis]NKE06830.1 S8 family serine peptidase [Mesobacillus selenatarsenatis]
MKTMIQKKNLGKKIAVCAMTTAMLLSNLGLASQSYAAPKTNSLETKISQYKQHLQMENHKKLSDHKKIKGAKAQLKASDKVRVIIEIDGETPVEHATSKGLLYKELSEDTKTSIANKLEKKQKSVQEKIKDKGVKVQYKNKFSTAFNGFSGEVVYGDLAKIEGIEGVKSVYLANEYKRPEVKPDMKTSHQFIQSSETWADAGLKGEGMIVSVIDSGVDPSHQDFVLTDASTAELDQAEVNKLVADKNLKGKYFTEKVPYGYNYFDQDDVIIDSVPGASMHGMHVAGTVAANGNEAEGGIKGVAPEAQVLAMKVFSNDPLFPSTWSDVYLAAIDESIKLGADVLNMSLGDVAAFYQEQSAEDLAISRAVDNGIVASVSAGNSGHIGYGWGNPFHKNPDIGVVGAPGLNPDSIQVAASGNAAFLFEHGITLEGAEDFTGVGYGLDDWSQLLEVYDSLELVSLEGGYGYPEEYEGKDVEGKVVVVQRGDLSFYEKTQIAADFGAVGIIVYDHGMDTFYENQGGWSIPFMQIHHEEGLALEELIAAGHTTLRVAQQGTSPDPEMGKMTDFTSWGTTPSLELKPEITAPGGKIISTLNDNQYGEMSGTSMAAPHVAGGSALVQQYLQNDERFEDLTAGERTRLAKVLLMNTAEMITDLEGQPFSPRRQGAGMMQTYAAVDTPVYIVNSETNESKVELKDFSDTQFEMTFTAVNISDEDATYQVNTSVLTDTIEESEGYENYNALVAGDMEGVEIDAPETIIVPAGETVDFTVSVDFTEAELPYKTLDGELTTTELMEDIFVEGFVTLEDAEEVDVLPTLNVPYVGFYGEWDRPEILDGFSDFGESKYYDLTGMFDYEDEEGNVYEEPVHDVLIDDWFAAPAEQGFYAISPNGDYMRENINPFPAFLRNAAEVQFNILDENEKFLRRVKYEKDVVKSYFDGGWGMPFSYNENRSWNGKVNSKSVKDGLYYYEIKSVIDYEGADYQSKLIPVYVDTVAPEVAASFDLESQTVSWETVEEGSGILSYVIFVNGEFYDEVYGEESSYQFEELPESAIVEVMAVDNAYNFGADTAEVGDVVSADPFVIAYSPEPYGAYNTKTIPVEGEVIDDNGLASITVNGKETSFTHDAGAGLYRFNTNVSFAKDGFYDVIIKAVDKKGQTHSLSRKVFIDTTAAQLSVSAPSRVDLDVEETVIKVTMKDNFNYLSLYVNDSHEYEKSIVSPVDVQKAANDTIDITVPLALGDNKISLRLIDLSGNETVKNLIIKRAEEIKNGWVKENGKWYHYKNNKPTSGWLLDKNKWYYLQNNHEMATGWLKIDKKWYLFDEVSGAMKTGWVKDDNKWYYLTAKGYMKTGWLNDGGKWYYLDSISGVMKTGWIKVENKWYYLAANGQMKTGWLKDGSKWYFLDQNSGVMKTGWIQSGGKWYYLYKNGSMAVNTVIDGYKLGKDGAWKK